jgi:hypothetical protein
MNLYRVDAKSYRFFHGLVQLTEKQARVRAHQIIPKGGDIFEIVQPIEFKAGEVLGFDGEVNARLLQNITPIAQVKGDEVPKASAPPPASEKEKSKEKPKK